MALRFTIIDQFGHSTVIDEPVGWDGIHLHYIRHKEWHGFIDTVDDTMGTLQFFGDGYHLLKNAFTTYGVEAQCGFLVEFQCSDTGSWDTIYQGQFSFYKYKEVQGVNGCHVECSVESSSNVMVLKNRYDQKVDLNSLIPFQTPQNPQASALNNIQAISTTQNYPPDPGLVDIKTGDSYLVPTPSGTWQSGTAGYIASWNDAGSWTYTPPQSGQVLVDMSTHKSYVFNGTTWGPFTGQMAAYNALGSEVLMPSKTIDLSTIADVNSNAGYAQDPGASPKVWEGGSTFNIVNDNQTAHVIQLSWLGGVAQEEVPSFVGANGEVFDNGGLGSGFDIDPIYTYNPDSNYNAKRITINININGTIYTTDPSNSYSNGHTTSTPPGQPIQITSMQGVLCTSTKGSFSDAYSNGILHYEPQMLDLNSGYSYVAPASGHDGYLNAYSDAPNNAPITFSFTYNNTINIVAGTSIYLAFGFNFFQRENSSNPNNGPAAWRSYAISNFTGSATFTIATTFPDTASPIYLVNESLSRVCEAITGGKVLAYSDFFGRTDSEPYTTSIDGEGSLLCFTNGLLIRGYTLLDGSRPPMPVSLKEMFEALNAIYNIGMSIESDPHRTGMNRLRIEPMQHFYQPDVILICDNVGEVSTENQAENYIGIFRTGYSKWQGEQTGGLDDFMNKREYRTALSTSKKVLEKYCNFLGSSYAIETTRRQTGINTQDWRFDHENFVICMERATPNTSGISPASGYATLDGNGAILDIVVTDGGSGYTLPPLVVIPAPTAPGFQFGGIQATAVATIVNGSVASPGVDANNIVIPAVQVTNQGYGYPGSTGSIVIIHFLNPPTSALKVEQSAVQNPTNIADTANIVDPNSLYNYRISPVRNAMRWVKSIFQSYSNWMGGVLHFSSGDANIKAKGQYAGIVESGHQIVPVIENAPIAEDSDISYSNFASATVSNYYPLYNNEIVKFTYPLSYNDWVTKIVPNPYGLIQYSVNDGAPQYGWIEDLKYSPYEGTAEFTLKKKL